MTAARLSLFLILFIASGFVTRAAGILTNAAADLVLGQEVFTTNTTSDPATPSTLFTPSGVAVDPVSGKVFAADQGNNRVLRYASRTALANGATPEIIIGQVNFSANTANQGNGAVPSQNSLSSPNDLFVDEAGRLWIADTGNNRVLMFENAAHLFNTPYADRVYGQPDFTHADPAATQATLAGPRGLCVDPAGTLWVADTGSHRVIAWKNAASLSNGAPADRVLGQTLYTTAVAATSQTGLFEPWDVAADDSNVWVADRGNNRVLLYPNFPTINGAPASLVLGQENYVMSTPATTAAGMANPTSVALDGSSLWVCDDGNNRILSFNAAASLAKGSDADAVVGQSTFTTGSSGLSSQKLALFESHIFVDTTTSLWVADHLNNRILRFTAESPAPVPPSAPPSVAVKGPKKIVTSRSSIVLRGTAAAGAGVLRVSYNLNGEGFVRAKGATNWKSKKILLEFGRNKIVINSVAADGEISPSQKVIVVRK